MAKIKVSEEFAEQVKGLSKSELSDLVVTLYKELEEWNKAKKEDADILSLKEQLKSASQLYTEKTKECKAKLNYVASILTGQKVGE